MISTSGPRSPAAQRSMSHPPITATTVGLAADPPPPLCAVPAHDGDVPPSRLRGRLRCRATRADTGMSTMTASRSPRVLAARARPTRSRTHRASTGPRPRARAACHGPVRSASATRSLRRPRPGGRSLVLGNRKVRHGTSLPGPLRTGDDLTTRRWPRRAPVRLDRRARHPDAAGYIPYRRLARANIAAFMGSGGGKGTAPWRHTTRTPPRSGSRPPASPSIRPGRTPDSLWFATSQPAYLDKTNATAPLGGPWPPGRRSAHTTSAGALRSGIGSLLAALRGVAATLVVAADDTTTGCRRVGTSPPAGTLVRPCSSGTGPGSSPSSWPPPRPPTSSPTAGGRPRRPRLEAVGGALRRETHLALGQEALGRALEAGGLEAGRRGAARGDGHARARASRA